MKNITLIGKQKGEFNGNPYYQLFFTETVDSKFGEGVKPFVRQSGTTSDGRAKFSHAIGCTVQIFEFLQIGETLSADDLLFNAKGKLAAVGD